MSRFFPNGKKSTSFSICSPLLKRRLRGFISLPASPDLSVVGRSTHYKVSKFDKFVKPINEFNEFLLGGRWIKKK